MDKKTMELYFYMNSHKPVYEWLVSEGATTKKQGVSILKKFFKTNTLDIEVIMPRLSVDEKNIIDNSGLFWVLVLKHFD